MANKRKTLQGVLPAAITPFTEDGSVKMDLFEKQVDYLIGAGAHGLFITGTTAEGAMIESTERCQLLQTAIDRTTDEHIRCVVVLRPDTPAVLRGIDDIASLQPDYVAAVAPYYLAATQAEIVGHFTTIAEHSPIPVLLYNIPQNTHNPMALETMLELAQHPNIVGIKDSSGNFAQFQRGLLTEGLNDFTWIQGEDLLDGPSFMTGVRCIVTGLGNVSIHPYVAMYNAAVAGDHDQVISHQRRINALAEIIFVAGGKGIAAIKEAVACQGRATPNMKVPAMKLTADEKARVDQVVGKLGLV